ncbi:MAG: 4Fe-4S binding protein [Anaerolineae bacterium]|nr:4Fe-4S binding protein [Anaerolineae bacterium]
MQSTVAFSFIVYKKLTTMHDTILPKIDLNRCVRCGECVRQCPTQAVEMCEEGPVIVRPEACTYCTACEALCPQGAIRCEFEIVWEKEAI